MRLETRPLKDIIPYENNPRINADAIPAVVESIKQCEYIAPIIVDEDGIILAGHTRRLALMKLGYKEVEVIVREGLSEAQKKKYRLLDNKTSEFAEWDPAKLIQELEGLDFDGFDFEWNVEAEKPEKTEAEEDNYDEAIPAVPRSHLGQIYQLGLHRLICGDSTDPAVIEKLMDGASADMCVTDPPYNVDYDNKEQFMQKYRPNERVKENKLTGIKNDVMSEEKFIAFLEAAMRNVYTALKPGGAFYIWHSDMHRFEFVTAVRNAGLTDKEVLIWVKKHFVLGRQDYQWKHEPCIYGWKEGGPHYFIDDRGQDTVIESIEDIKKMKAEQMRSLLLEIFEDWKTTVIHEDKPAKSDLHPTMKPLKLIGRQVTNSSRRNEKVLDIFGGSGSTLMACEQLNRQCYMCELDPRYVDVIIDRWETYTGAKAELIFDPEG